MIIISANGIIFSIWCCMSAYLLKHKVEFIESEEENLSLWWGKCRTDFNKLFCIQICTLMFNIILDLILKHFLPFLWFRMFTECDQTFVSRPGGPQNGTFTAPIINNPSNHSRQCLYIFLAGPGQRVEIIFTTFNLRGSPPEYVQIMKQLSFPFFPDPFKHSNNSYSNFYSLH